MSKNYYFVNLKGHRFGNLLVVERDKNFKKAITWKCICDCGNIKTIIGNNLKNGTTKSCGCVRKKITSERMKTHGKTKTTEYRIWGGMFTRCYNKKVNNYHLYGGRGIKVCDRWSNFQFFLDDMGFRPKNKTLDRINVNGNYEPSNCRWASKKEQGQNKRKTKLINKDSLLSFLNTQKYLTNDQRNKIVENYFQ